MVYDFAKYFNLRCTIYCFCCPWSASNHGGHAQLVKDLEKEYGDTVPAKNKIFNVDSYQFQNLVEEAAAQVNIQLQQGDKIISFGSETNIYGGDYLHVVLDPLLKKEKELVLYHLVLLHALLVEVDFIPHHRLLFVLLVLLDLLLKKEKTLGLLVPF